MSSVQERLKLKRVPTDIWSVREQLCLASSVLKSGDQNWMSVSRSLKTIADKDSVRPSDWFSQKSCAQQYAYLIENADIPKRKKRESGETTDESIVRRLTHDRISELNKILITQREEYLQLKNEISLLKNGTASGEKLQKMWFAIEQEEKEQEQKNKVHVAWLTKRQQSKESQSTQTLHVHNVQKKVNDYSIEHQDVTEINTEEEKRNKNGRSSLLTSLLKSSSPTTQIQALSQATGSPTIASLLCSSPKVPGPVIIQNVSTQLQQLVSTTVPDVYQERPSASAPTLSMLLEQPAGTQRALQQQLQNTSNLINSKNLQSPIQVQNIMQTRSGRITQGNSTQIEQVQQDISNPDFSSPDIIPQILTTPIDDIMPKVINIGNDEMNDIIGDIEELIKEEITGSPQTLDTSSRTIEIIDHLNIQGTNLLTERLEPRNVDESVSLSNSPTSEISIEEIDSSTSNIAEIIGTAIGNVESKISTPDFLKETENIEESKFIVEDIKKEIIKSVTSEECKKIKTKDKLESVSVKELIDEADNKTVKGNILIEDLIDSKEENKESWVEKEVTSKYTETACEIADDEEIVTSKNKIESKEYENENIMQQLTSEIVSISSDETSDSLNQEEKTELQDIDKISKDKEMSCDLKIEENVINEGDVPTKIINDLEIFSEQKAVIPKSNSENVDQLVKEPELVKEYDTSEHDLNGKDKQECKETIESLDSKIEEDTKKSIEISIKETEVVMDCKLEDEKPLEIDKITDFNSEIVLKKEKSEESSLNEEIKENENSESRKIKNEIKTEPKKEDNETNEEECKQKKEETKKEIESETIKKENIESVGSVEELDEEEPTLSKLSGGRAMKTYSKKQNVTVDSETENETGGETADYRAWKKSIMLVYNRLSTHKYASIFLRPITEDQAPGYHSIIFRPMDLWTIKKNIDNGTIRSTTHFQRDVMLMFQNAIMFNKHNTLVHKMTLEMQEECLQHMQVLVRAAGEASFRRETRTAASISNEAADSNLKRKWTHVTSSPHETESPRMKKRRKSEND